MCVCAGGGRQEQTKQIREHNKSFVVVLFSFSFVLSLHLELSYTSI